MVDVLRGSFSRFLIVRVTDASINTSLEQNKNDICLQLKPPLHSSIEEHM